MSDKLCPSCGVIVLRPRCFRCWSCRKRRKHERDHRYRLERALRKHGLWKGKAA